MGQVHKMGIKKVTQTSVSTDEDVTAAMADRYLQVGKYDLQRKSDDAHVDELVIEINTGRFLGGTAVAFCVLPDGHYILVNGKHTLKAIRASGVTTRLTVVRHYVKDMTEVGEVYSKFDINKTRTAYDRLVALGVPAAFAVSLSKQQTNGLTAGIKIILSGFQNKNSSGYDPAINKSAEIWANALTTAWKPAIERYFYALEFCETARQKQRFLKAGVVAVALPTLRYQHRKGFEFWGEAAAKDGLRARNPAARLADWLVLTGNIRGGGSRQLMVCRHVAACWNKYYDGLEMGKIVPVDVGKNGLTINGTPYKARVTSARK